MNSDFTVDLKTNDIEVHSIDHEQEWEVTLAFTGNNSMTGARIAIAASKYLGNADNFAVTYGDGLTNADLADELNYHSTHKKIGTVLGVNPPSRFGEIKIKEDQVIEFDEKPEFTEKWINGGYFFFNKKFLDYLSEDENCVLEREPLVKLARDGELNLFKHRGFWGCMDTQRDREYLTTLWQSGDAPWKK